MMLSVDKVNNNVDNIWCVFDPRKHRARTSSRVNQSRLRFIHILAVTCDVRM